MIADLATNHYDYIPPIVAAAAERQSPLANSVITVSSDPVPPTTIEYGQFTPHFAKLKKLATDSRLWSSESEPPSIEALAWSQVILQRFFDQDVPPARVVASAEGGAALCFIDGNKYADIESLNTGGDSRCHFLTQRNKPVAWEIEPSEIGIARAVERVRNFIVTP